MEGLMVKNFFRVISGGQTGVDRAALDAAMKLGIEVGGFCPKGRRAEDGPIDEQYPLTETASRAYPVRTEKNVAASDGTLILTGGPLKGGTALTVRLAKKHGKPYLILDPARQEEAKKLRKWLRIYAITVLNVAGPRESESPGIYERSLSFLEKALKQRDPRQKGR